MWTPWPRRGPRGRLPLWLPGKLLREQAELPVGWQTTADSLALWFADHIGAEALILIKAAPKEGTEVDELAASGYVDSHFPELARKTRLKRLACFCIDELGPLEQALRVPVPACLRLVAGALTPGLLRPAALATLRGAAPRGPGPLRCFAPPLSVSLGVDLDHPA